MTRRNSTILATVAVLAAVGAYWFLLFAPKQEQVTSLDAKIVAKQGEFTTAKATLATNESARAAFRVNYSTVARLGKAVPDDDDVRSLLVQVDGAAGSSKIDFRTISLGAGGAAAAPASTDQAKAGTGTTPPPGAQAVGSAGFAAMPYAMTFRGDFFRIGDFFQRIDRFVTVRDRGIDVTGRLMLLNSIELVPDDVVGFPKMKAQVNATTYLVPATQGLTLGATPQGPAAVTAPGATPTPAPAAPTTTTATISPGAKTP